MFDVEKLQKEKSRLIEKELENVLPRNTIKNLHDAAWYHLETGGKKLRPLLAIATYEALAGKNDAKQTDALRAIGSASIEKILPFAAACELLHNWLLVHDDIEDGDKIRRNKPAVWVKYGLAHGINVGDYMAHKVFDLVLLSKERGVGDETVFTLLKAMTETTIKTAEGQALDINMRNSDNPSEEEYIDMITGKTAHYLTIPMIGAAIVAEREELVPNLIDFGKNLGPAFQIADDVLDLTEGKGRQETGRDIKEGKRSILVIHCMGKCSTEERRKLLYILNKPVDKTSSSDIAYVKNLFEKYGSIKYAKRLAEEFALKSKRIVSGMPKELKEILYFFADYSVQRRK